MPRVARLSYRRHVLVVVAAATRATTAAAAPAAFLNEIWIRHREALIHQAFDVVDFRSFDVGKAVRVDDEIDSGKLDDGVVRCDLVVESHPVADAAILRLNEKANRNAFGVLFADDVSKALDR